jgi:hypothetical protein
VNELTTRAIASSSKLQKLSQRITIIDERLAVTEDRIDYTKKKSWTNYISANPIDIIQNIFGGGGVQRDRIEVSPEASAAAPPIWKSKQPIYLLLRLN